MGPAHLEGDEMLLKEPHVGREASPNTEQPSPATSDMGQMSGPFFLFHPISKIRKLRLREGR